MGWERCSVGFGVWRWPPGDVWGWTVEIPWSEIVYDGKCDRDFFLCCLRALDNDVIALSDINAVHTIPGRKLHRPWLLDLARKGKCHLSHVFSLPHWNWS
jgi:hypothetical protein